MNEVVNRGSRWHALGRSLGVFGVIASLLLVAYQIRQANAVARAQVYQEWAASLRELNASIVNDEGFSALIGRAVQGETMRTMSDAEARRLMVYLMSVARMWENLWVAVREGIVDPAVLSAIGAYGLLDTDFFREAWPQLRAAHDPEFVEFFEALEWNH